MSKWKSYSNKFYNHNFSSYLTIYYETTQECCSDVVLVTFGDFIGYRDIFTAKTLNFLVPVLFHQGTALHQMARRHSPLPFHPHTLKPDKLSSSPLGPIFFRAFPTFKPKIEDWKIRHDQIIPTSVVCLGCLLKRSKHHLLQPNNNVTMSS